MKFIDLSLEYNNLKHEIDQAIQGIIDSTSFIMGDAVLNFEKNFGKFIETKYAYGVSSGTDALLLALMAIDLQPGDEVITTPFTFVATAEVILLLRAKPVFVDIDLATYNIDTSKIEEKISKKTKAIIPVHLYGHPANMDEILNLGKKYSLCIIEDACQSAGSTYKGQQTGSISDMGCFSFFPSKNLGCYGDGGLITTNNDNFAYKLNAMRNHGSIQRYHHEMLGINGRLDALQAAILDVKLSHFKKTIEMRAQAHKLYESALANIKQIILPITKPNCTHTFGQFTIRTKQRDALCKYLNEQKIPTAIHYPIPLHLQPVFSYLGYRPGDLPCAEQASQEVLSLPFYPGISKEDVEKIGRTIQQFFIS